MPSVQVTDFRRGIDRTRKRIAGTPGSLWVGKNCHIGRGGDIDGVKKFVTQYTLPAGTHGMEEINGQLFVFGSADLAATTPNGVQYQRLQNSTAVMTRVLSSAVFDGKTYVIADYDTGNIDHFYDGTRVSAWDALADGAFTYKTLAEYLARKLNANAAVDAISFGNSILITAVVPGTLFTLTSAVVGSGTATVSTPQLNVTEVPETRAAGTVTITGGTADPGINRLTQITVNSIPLMAVPIDWFASNSATANAATVEINNNTSTHGYSASALGAVITFQAAPGLGATVNGHVVATAVAGNVTTSTVTITGGVTYVASVAQISKVVLGGTPVATEKFTLTLNSVDYVATGRASAHGTSAFVYKGRIYATARSFMRFCALNAPTDWTTTGADGAGFINVASDSQGDQRLTGMAVFQSSVAVFSRSSIRTYSLAADPGDNVLQRVIENAGAIAPRSIMPYFNTDVLFLDQPGVRALRSNTVNGDPYVDDTGTQVDTLFQEWFDSVTEDAVERAVAVVEPLDGRYLLAIGNRVFVLSYFPRQKIEAWTYYEPGITITDFAQVDKRLYARDATKIYLYGGTTGQVYPSDAEQDISVELPFIGVKNPAEFKEWTGFDAACTGVWRVQALVDPRHEEKVVEIGRITGTTYNHGGIAAIGESTLFALKLTCDEGGATSISSLMLHYDGGDSET